MTIALVGKTSGIAAGAAPNATASVSKTLDRIYLVAVGMTTNTSTNPTTPSLGGTNISQIGSPITLGITTSGTNRRYLALLVGKATGTSSNAINISWSGTPPTRVGWTVTEATEVDLTTPLVASNNKTDTGTATNGALMELSPAMNALAKVENRLYFVEFGNTNVLPRSENDADKAGSTNSKDWTDLNNANQTSAPVFRMLSAWLDNAAPDLTPGFVVADTPIYGLIAVELNAIVAAVAQPYFGVGLQ